MKKNDFFNGFTLLVAILCLLTFSLNMYNGRFHLGDFMVYYSAAKNLVTGEPVYMVTYYTGSGFYKYSPSTLFLFLPYVLFNFKTAAIIHFFILGTAYGYTFMLIRRLIRDFFLIGKRKHEMWLLSVSFVCILIHFAREMYLGNINIILLMLCCLSVQKFLTGKEMQGGVFLALAVLTKPYLLIVLLPVVLRKKWRALTWTGLAAGCALILPFIYPGPRPGIGLYHDWIKSMLSHGEGFPGMTSLDYFLRLLFPAWPAWGILVIFFSVCTFVALFILDNIRKEKAGNKPAGMADMNFVFEWFLLIALLPNLIRTDWVLMLFSAPLITFVIFSTASAKKYRQIPLLVILLFFYSANSDDLLGRELSHTLLHSGLMGLSNFLLVLFSLLIFLRHRTSSMRM